MEGLGIRFGGKGFVCERYTRLMLRAKALHCIALHGGEANCLEDGAMLLVLLATASGEVESHCSSARLEEKRCKAMVA